MSIEIKKGLVDKTKIDNDDWYIRQSGNVIRQLRPTEQPHVKSVWSGGVNGMTKVGTFELSDGSYSFYSGVRFDKGVSLPPLALYEWGVFLTGYVNTITVDTDKFVGSGEQKELEDE